MEYHWIKVKKKEGFTMTISGDTAGQASVVARPGHLRATICQRNAGGVDDPLGDASAACLWKAATEPQRRQIAERFAQARADDVRDALLDAEDSSPPADQSARATSLGRRLWRLWTHYRDQSVERLQIQGQLRTDFPRFNFEESPCRSRP
jgi:hypothetical protein